jgi:hypothetical protein
VDRPSISMGSVGHLIELAFPQWDKDFYSLMHADLEGAQLKVVFAEVEVRPQLAQVEENSDQVGMGRTDSLVRLQPRAVGGSTCALCFRLRTVTNDASVALCTSTRILTPPARGPRSRFLLSLRSTNTFVTACLDLPCLQETETPSFNPALRAYH